MCNRNTLEAVVTSTRIYEFFDRTCALLDHWLKRNLAWMFHNRDIRASSRRSLTKIAPAKARRQNALSFFIVATQAEQHKRFGISLLFGFLPDFAVTSRATGCNVFGSVIHVAMVQIWPVFLTCAFLRATSPLCFMSSRFYFISLGRLIWSVRLT